MAESRDDARDDFSVTMMADEDVGPCSPITDRNHQLLGMPKGQNNVTPFPIQRIDGFVPTGLTPHRTTQSTDQDGRNRRQQRTLHPLLDVFFQALLVLGVRHSPLPTVQTLAVS